MLLHVLQTIEKETDRCSSVPCFFLLASCFIIHALEYDTYPKVIEKLLESEV